MDLETRLRNVCSSLHDNHVTIVCLMQWRRVSAPATQLGVPVVEDTSDNEGDLGEIGGIGSMDVDSEGDEDESIPESARKAKKRRIHAITRNTALVSIVSISIILTDTFNIQSEVCCLHQHFFTEHKREVQLPSEYPRHILSLDISS